ncbi:MAG: alpha-amylase family glycosyl hydrolase [Candidatus Krumholzibacteriia bacterium]
MRRPAPQHDRFAPGLFPALLLFLALAAAGCGHEQTAAPPAPGSSPARESGGTALDTLLLRAYDVDSVHLAGSFNAWNSQDPSYALTADPDGYTWRLAVSLPAGPSYYKYVLRRGSSVLWLTDPAAPEVSPDGYHASPAYWNGVLGRTFTTPRPLPAPVDRTRLVIYEIAPNDFSQLGTFTGIEAGLTAGPDLADLAVNAVELMPVTVPSYNGWGYDPVLFFAPNPSYGSPGTFAGLVDAAHERGIAVILDMVLNHAGGATPFRQLDQFTGTYRFTTQESNPWGLVELNWSDPAMRAYLLEACCHWVDAYRVDGFRFDYIGGEPYSNWVWLKDELRARYPDLLLIAEDFTYPAYGNAVTHGYDAQWGGNHTDSWGGGGNNFLQVLTTVLTEQGFAWRGSSTPTVGAFGTTYRNMWAVANVVAGNPGYGGPVPGDGFSDVKFLESHDENRLVWSVDTYGAAGAQLVGGLQKAQLGALINLTTVGIPMLYNGQEIGSGEYRPADPVTYKIDWTAGDPQLRAAYRHLIALRLQEPALASEHVFFHWRADLADHTDMTLTYWRGATDVADDATVVVAANFDHQTHTWTVPFPGGDGFWYRHEPATGDLEPVGVAEGGLQVSVPASTALLWTRGGTTSVP